MAILEPSQFDDYEPVRCTNIGEPEPQPLIVAQSAAMARKRSTKGQRLRGTPQQQALMMSSTVYTTSETPSSYQVSEGRHQEYKIRTVKTLAQAYQNHPQQPPQRDSRVRGQKTA